MSGVEDTGTAGPDEEPDESGRVGALRGAGVQIDSGRIGYIAAVLALVVVMVVAGVLLIAGIRKNSQINSLRSDSVPVESTVTRCLALIGGTGSSPAGFECTGTYHYQGKDYTEGIPGTQDLPVGSTVHGIVASGDPALFSTRQTVDSEHPAAVRVVVPAIVLVAATVVWIWVVVRRRRKDAGS
jgi:hypothetical protein